MSERGFQIRDQFAVHFITCSVVEWVDVFTRKMYADILVDSLKFCQQNKGLVIHAWCIMSNPIHLILSTNGITQLSDILRDFKKFSSSQAAVRTRGTRKIATNCIIRKKWTGTVQKCF